MAIISELLSQMRALQLHKLGVFWANDGNRQPIWAQDQTDIDEANLLCILLNPVEVICVIWSSKQLNKVFIMSNYYQLKVTLGIPAFDDTVVNERETDATDETDVASGIYYERVLCGIQWNSAGLRITSLSLSPCLFVSFFQY